MAVRDKGKPLGYVKLVFKELAPKLTSVSPQTNVGLDSAIIV